MIVSIHQPNYIPYLGFFDKVNQSDIFIVHDDCQFVERDWQHRNKIRIFNGWKWLTIPVHKKEVSIKDIRIKNEKPKNGPLWSKAHCREIEANYSKTPFFDSYYEDVKNIYDKAYSNLIDLNRALIEFLFDAFGMDAEIKYASEFGLNSKATQKIIDLVNEVGGDVYLSGIGGKNYLDLPSIKDFKVIFQKFKHPVYPQRYSGFEPNMAAIDALFNVGELPETKVI
jgi:hypothetical protein